MDKIVEIKKALLAFSEEPETFREYILYERLKRIILNIINDES